MHDWRKLELLRLAADDKARSDERFEDAIIAAHLEGFSTREIEPYAGISRETIRKIISRKVK